MDMTGHVQELQIAKRLLPNPPPHFSHPDPKITESDHLSSTKGDRQTMIENNSIKLIADFAKAVLDEPSPNQLLSLIALKVLAPLDCRGAILGIIRQEGFLDLVGSYGYKDSSISQFTSMPLWTPLPITDAARTGEVSIFRTSKEVVEKYPHLAQVDEGEGCTVSVPLIHRNTVVGALGFTSIKEPSSHFDTGPLADVFTSLCSIYALRIIEKNEEIEPDLSSIAPSLSPRQKQIIKLFDDELTTEQIADRLRFSPSTIKQDIIKIYGIFGVSSRSTVYELAKKAGIVEVN